jgi:outer membrane receptor protein involved in Fe transport
MLGFLQHNQHINNESYLKMKNCFVSGRSAFFICLVLCLLSELAHSQAKIAGRITDPDNKPLLFASVVLLHDTSFMAGTISDELGNFEIASICENGKKYTLRVSLIGYKPSITQFIYPDTNFNNQIILAPDKNLLGSVTISAQKPFIVRKVDKYIIDIENSFLANGNSGLEVLQKSPGIIVDNFGNIKIKGSQSVTVMINNVVQRMSGEELTDYLKTLKSEDISKIEVIYNPSAELEAAGSGGVIHIVLKKARKDGLTGSVNGQYRHQGRKPYLNDGSSLYYKFRSLSLYGNYTLSKDVKRIIERSAIVYPDNSEYKSFTDRLDNMVRQQGRFGVAFDLSSRHSIGVETIVASTNWKQAFITDKNYFKTTDPKTGTANLDRLRKLGFNSTTLNFINKIDSIGSTLKVIAEYTTNSKSEHAHYMEEYADPTENSIYRNSVPNNTRLYSSQVDFVKVFNKNTEWKIGVKYNSINRDNAMITEDLNNNTWVNDSAGSDHFLYKERLFMVYSSIEKSVKKTSVKLGLRGEQTHSTGISYSLNQQFSKDYFNIFPSLYILQNFGGQSRNSLYLNYSRRLTRPALIELNPNRWIYSNNTASTGNPDLKPQYTHNLELGFKYLSDYQVNVYLAQTENVIALLTTAGNNNFTEYKYQNFKNSTEYGLNLNAPFKVLKGWTMNNSLLVYHLSYAYDNTGNDQTSFSIKSFHAITLKSIIDINAIANYNSPTVYGNLKMLNSFNFDIGFLKSILKSKGRLNLYFSDIFNTLREKEITNDNGSNILFYRKRPTRTISFSFTYNFSAGKKFESKKIEQSNSERSRIDN